MSVIKNFFIKKFIEAKVFILHSIASEVSTKAL